MYFWKNAYPSIISQFLRILHQGFTINIYLLPEFRVESIYYYKSHTHTKNSFSFH